MIDTAVSGTCIELDTLLRSSPCATSVKGPTTATACSCRRSRTEATGKRMDVSTVAPLGIVGGKLLDGRTAGVAAGVLDGVALAGTVAAGVLDGVALAGTGALGNSDGRVLAVTLAVVDKVIVVVRFKGARHWLCDVEPGGLVCAGVWG